MQGSTDNSSLLLLHDHIRSIDWWGIGTVEAQVFAHATFGAAAIALKEC